VWRRSPVSRRAFVSNGSGCCSCGGGTENAHESGMILQINALCFSNHARRTQTSHTCGGGNFMVQQIACVVDFGRISV
jgi:hypothetical protein